MSAAIWFAIGYLICAAVSHFSDRRTFQEKYLACQLKSEYQHSGKLARRIGRQRQTIKKLKFQLKAMTPKMEQPVARPKLPA